MPLGIAWRHSVAHRGRKNADETLALALACGATVEIAAQKAGVSRRTAHRRLKDADFQELLKGLKAEMVERAGGTLTAAGMEAIKTLVALLQVSMPPAARLGAARTILEFGMKFREAGELTERIAALEAQLALRQ